MLPFTLLELFVERLAKTFASSLSFRIAASYSVLISLLLLGFLAFLYYGLSAIFGVDQGGYIVISESGKKHMVLIAALVSLFIGLMLSYLGKALSDKLISPIKNMSDEVRAISSKDLSKRLDEKAAKDELKDLALYFNIMMNDIEKSYKKRSQFVSDASHELRTPISVISGYANLLNRWGKTDASILQESIDAIISESKQMQSLVEKLLFLARSDKNELKLDTQLVDAAAIMGEVYREMQLIEKGREFSFAKSGDWHFVMANPEMLKQLLRIFVDNAVKFTDSGGKIDLRIEGGESGIQMKVKDDGIGIPEEDLPKIFDRFYRADKSRSAERRGTGLGLSIAKYIIVAHDGKVHIDSEVGEGTEVCLTLLPSGKIVNDNGQSYHA